MNGQANMAPGGKFLPAGEAGKRRRPTWRWTAALWLALGDGLLVYMILSGLIDQRYGVMILAGWSAYFGNKIGRRF